jgi:hypothetical protein
MPTTRQTLTIGGVDLVGFEVPNDIPQLFGVQKMAVHDFPGGQRTIQNLGAFPHPFIEWTGNLFNGNLGANTADTSQAMFRAETLNNLRLAAQPVALTWGAFNMQVVVAEFEVTAKMAQWLIYRIKLVPFLDNTPADPAAQNPNAQANLKDAQNQFANATDASTSGYTFSSAIVSQSIAIQSAINAAMITANQSLANVPQTTITAIQEQIGILQLTLDGLMGNSDFSAVAAAVNLFGAAGILSEALGADIAGPITITLIDPDLNQIAAQYYNDVSQAGAIALANNLQDFYLVGSYTLTLPNLV